MTTGIPLAAVIGHPIQHSRSPALHGFWLQQIGIKGHYVPVDVAPGELAQAFDALRRLGFRGANVTAPHKEHALALADTVTDRARSIGAANTITFDADGTIHADNTDGIGFLENLRQSHPGWRADAGPAGVLGAGGAARAVIAGLLDEGAPEIRLTNRSPDRAQVLADLFGPRVTLVPWADAGAVFAGVATAVNATTLGMASHAPFDVSLDALPVQALATDLVYAPLDTVFLQKARARGCPTVDGLGMLLHQAAPGFARWFGQMPQVTDQLRAAVLAA